MRLENRTRRAASSRPRRRPATAVVIAGLLGALLAGCADDGSYYGHRKAVTESSLQADSVLSCADIAQESRAIAATLTQLSGPDVAADEAATLRNRQAELAALAATKHCNRT